MLTLDVGCGYLPSHKRREGIGIDLIKGRADIVADVERLPFRDNTFTKVYLRNVLEHLDNPLECLRDVKRVTKSGAIIEITIPVQANTFYQEIERFILGFPFRTVGTIQRLNRFRKHGKNPGFRHKNKIQPKHIGKFFQIISIEFEPSKHPWFRGRKGKLLQRLGIKPLPSIGKNWYIKACV